MMTYHDPIVGRIRSSIKEDCFEIARNMRAIDIQEAWSAMRLSPIEVAEYSFDRSIISMTILHNEMPIVMFGIIPDNMSSGVLWMLTTNELNNIGRPFVRNCKAWFRDMLEIYPELWGTVDLRNKASIRWLDYLGCEWGKTMPFGIDKMPFIKFSFKKDRI